MESKSNRPAAVVPQKSIGLVFCLSIDLIGSTKAGLELSTTALDRFNKNLVDQITPHLEMLDLMDALIKFTGDGWLLISDRMQHVPALCCLATIMAKMFKTEMSDATNIPQRDVPALRIAICSGRDLRVELPDGRVDWVGDSARRAVRAAGFCMPNEIVVNGTVRDIIFRDFEIATVAKSGRTVQSLTGSEEDFPLYILGELNTRAVVDSDAPECYVNTLSVIGRQREAVDVAERVSERLELEATAKPESDKGRLLRRFNRLLGSRVDYETALGIFNNLRDANLTPNVVTYSTLINLAPDYEEAKRLVAQMREELITPDVVTYNTLINLVPDYKEAKRLVAQMQEELITPNVVTYSTLINLVPDYEEAKRLVAQMRAESITPNVVTYNTLINFAPDYEEARALVAQMREELIPPNVVTHSTLINLAPDYEEAKRLVAQMREESITPNVVTYNTLINLAPDYEEATQLVAQMQQESITPNVVTYNTLINLAPNYEEAKRIVAQMREESITPNVVTYNTLINLAPDYEETRGLVAQMREESIALNVVTYTTLINLVPDYEEAKRLIAAMRAESITPNVVTYTTLINLVPDYEEAKRLVAQMWAESITPNAVTYSTLFAKGPKSESPDEILQWYLAQRYHPEMPLQALISFYRRSGQIEKALRLVLDYPHLDAARSLIRHFKVSALTYFHNNYAKNPTSSNAPFALGMTLLESGEAEQAKFYLEQALARATSEHRRATLRGLLKQVESELD